MIFIMYLFVCFFSFKDYYVDKLDSYECGFFVSGKFNFGFNLVFFSIVLIFVVFELEVIIFILLVQGDVYSVFSFFLFFLYVVISFYIEFYFGKLL